MRNGTIAAIAAILLTLAGTASAGEVAAGDLVVRDPWSRATVGAVHTGVIYLTVANRGVLPDRLVAVSTPVAGAASLHRSEMAGGMMRMRPVAAIEVAPGEAVTLEPGGLHIMLTSLARPLSEGETFAAVLTFERAGTVRIAVVVGKPGALHGGAMRHD